MDKILITGGAGFIGSTLANHLATSNEVYVVDDLSMGSISNLDDSPAIVFIEGSVTDDVFMETLIKTHEFDYVYHLAAIASVADSVERPIDTHKTNFESVLMLLELLRKYTPNLKRFVYTSSAAVYGDEPTLPKKEESVIRPMTPYAIDKFSAEKYVVAYNELYGVPASAVRFFNVYGPNQNPNSPYSGVISIIMDKFERAIAGEEISFTMFGDGSQSRDFVYIEDVIQALILIATTEETKGKVYNVGTGVGTTLKELFEIIVESSSVEVPIQYESVRAGDIPFSYADISKLQSVGYESKYNVYEGLKKYLESLIKE